MKPNEQIRYELITAVSQLGKLRPDWRLGQTLANLATTAGRLEVGGIWNLEDEEALTAAYTLIQQYTERGSDLVNPGDELKSQSNDRPTDNEFASVHY